MRLLLDTHTFLWWLDGDRRLSSGARRYIADERHVVLLSAASAWEITTKALLGKLPGEHRDPFDRMLVAQAQLEDLPVLSNDRIFDLFGVTRLW